MMANANACWLKRGVVFGKSDKTGSAPAENPVHPRELLATIGRSSC